MSVEILSALIPVIILIIALVYLDIIDERATKIEEIAQSYGWADMDKVRKLDGRRYEPAPVATDAQYFTMPDGTKIHRH